MDRQICGLGPQIWTNLSKFARRGVVAPDFQRRRPFTSVQFRAK
jgi:hypothetical protein